MSILNRRVLVLNRSWVAIGEVDVKKALEDMNSSVSPKKALKIEYARNLDGTFNFDEMIEVNPLDWDEWITLLPREFDSGCIHTVSLSIRVPTIVITPNYNKIPLKTFRPTKFAIAQRDNFTCQYTGRKLNRSEISIDHVFPKSRARDKANDWTNLVTCDKKVNFDKADRTPEEAGLKLLRKPIAPSPIPMTALIDEKHIDWKRFLVKK